MADLVYTSFPVTGLSCAACAVSVESILKSTTGVENAAVNFVNASAQIRYNPQEVTKEKLKQQVQSIGYDLLIESPEEAAEKAEKQKMESFRALKRRTILSLVFSTPLFIIGMFFMDMPYANYIMWALASPVVLWFGRQFFIQGARQLRHRTANMDTLVALSTGIAYIYSVYNTLSASLNDHHTGETHVYFEAAAVVISFILLGKLLEENAKSNTTTALKKLIGLQPREVLKVHPDGKEEIIKVSEVMQGDLLLVKPGDKIPVDGAVTDGSSYVDEAMISGEPIPVLKEAGKKVFAGTLNQKGILWITAEKLGGESLLGQIIRLVKEAQGSKAPVQKLVDKIAAVFVPVILGIAAISFAGWALWGGEEGINRGLMAMVTVLIIACPCALGLATPAAIMVGIGKGATHGIFIKDAESLELAHKVNAIILDKTGTITLGKPHVNHIHWTDKTGQEEAILFAMEKRSTHPLAEAIVRYLEEKNFSPVSFSNFRVVPGKGMTAKHNGETYHVGSLSFLKEQEVEIPPALETSASTWLEQAHTVTWFSNATEALAVISISDPLKEGSAAAVKALQAMHIEVIMITGDHSKTAKAIADAVGIHIFRAETLPADKANAIQDLRRQGKIIAMAGDGINDTYALAKADVSIAMGKGSDVAMDVAQMTIMSSDLRLIPKAILLSQKTVRVIRQNLFWAFIYNIIGIPIAAGVLYPVSGFLLNPMIAGAAMALSSVSVVVNSLRLKAAKL